MSQPSTHLEATGAPIGKTLVTRAYPLRLVNERVGEVGPSREWMDVYQILQGYALEYGTTALPRNCTYHGVSLGFWVARQRLGRTRLTQEQQELLEALPQWKWSPRSSRWEEVYAILAAYTERTGSAKVPRTYRESGYGLGKWVSRMRSRRHSLTDSQVQALESLAGWVWHSRRTS